MLGRNCTYIVFRKLHTRVAAYRRYLQAKAKDREGAALLGAKMVGRWQSGAPLVLSPDRDDPELGADPHRNNDFLYRDDLRGFKCPAGAHARRANPRDALDNDGSVNVGLHRMIRRGTSYGDCPRRKQPAHYCLRAPTHYEYHDEQGTGAARNALDCVFVEGCSFRSGELAVSSHGHERLH